MWSKIVCLFKGHLFNRVVPVWVDFSMEVVEIQVCDRCGAARVVED